MDSVDEVPPCWSELALAPGSWVGAGVEAAGGGPLLYRGFTHTAIWCLLQAARQAGQGASCRYHLHILDSSLEEGWGVCPASPPAPGTDPGQPLSIASPIASQSISWPCWPLLF